jgi:hypothetical protein
MGAQEATEWRGDLETYCACYRILKKMVRKGEFKIAKRLEFSVF